MDWMSKSTVLGTGARGFDGCAHPANCELRVTLRAGEGSIREGAASFRVGAIRRQFVKKFVSEQWILSCKSLGRPLVSHL
jgi:hypothetical protein